MHSIILIEGHPIVGLGVQSLIDKTDKFFIAQSFTSGKEGLKAIKLAKPDIAIIDLSLQRFARRIDSRGFYSLIVLIQKLLF